MTLANQTELDAFPHKA